MKHPPEPFVCGADTDNCGNVQATIAPHILDDVINDLEHGDIEGTLAILREMQGYAVSLQKTLDALGHEEPADIEPI